MRQISIVMAVVSMAFVTSVPTAAQTAPRATSYTEVTQWPDWSGVWSPGVGAGSRTTPTPPVFTPAGKKLADAFEAGKAKGENLQNPAANCVPNGMPGIMRLPYPIEFIYSPGRVNVLIETYSQVRRIYIDQPLPSDPDDSFNGSSVGHWEGDTLVVDSVGFSPIIQIVPGVHPTETTRFRERITRTGDLMTDEITLTDPALFAAPYVQVQKYKLEPEWQMREYICQENNHDAADANGRPSMKLDDAGDGFKGID